MAPRVTVDLYGHPGETRCTRNRKRLRLMPCLAPGVRPSIRLEGQRVASRRSPRAAQYVAEWRMWLDIGYSG